MKEGRGRQSGKVGKVKELSHPPAFTTRLGSWQGSQAEIISEKRAVPRRTNVCLIAPPNFNIL